MSAIATTPRSLQPLGQRDLVAPVARAARDVAHDQAGGPAPASASSSWRGAAGVADVRIGQRDELARVGRVGEDFLVAGHRGVEHHLADGQAGRADGNALEDGAVFEGEDCGLGHGRRLGEVDPPRPVPPAARAAAKRGHGVSPVRAGGRMPKRGQGEREFYRRRTRSRQQNIIIRRFARTEAGRAGDRQPTRSPQAVKAGLAMGEPRRRRAVRPARRCRGCWRGGSIRCRSPSVANWTVCSPTMSPARIDA